jgi:hypothetical protein
MSIDQAQERAYAAARGNGNQGATNLATKGEKIDKPLQIPPRIAP